MDTPLDSMPPDNMTAFDTEPLTQSPKEAWPTQAEPTSCDIQPLTSLSGTKCANPFCQNPLAAKAKYGPAKRYCSQHCRMDGYVLRRASTMLHEVGLIEFYERLHRVK
jgi:hypothetical protein